MPDVGLSDLLPALLLGLLAPLPQAAAKCDPLTCLKGFTCCGDTCCWLPASYSTLKLFITVILSVLLFLCLCGVLKHFCRKCKEPEPELDLSMDYSVDLYTRHPRPYPEEIRAPIPENPPPYDEVILKPNQDLPPREPPPPYSFRPEGSWGVNRGIDNPAF